VQVLTRWLSRRGSVARRPADPNAAAHEGAGAGYAPFAGSRVLVCGASGALGAAVADAFVAGGANVFLHAHRRPERVAKMAAELNGGPSGAGSPTPLRAHHGQADLRDPAQTRALLARAHSELGGLNVVVTAVGAAKDAPLLLVDAADIEASLRDNLLPVVNVCEAFRELLAAHDSTSGARIVNVSSVTGLVGQPMRVAYGAAKGAVVSYTKSVAREVAEFGITANCVAPQVIEGGLADLMKARVRSILLANTPVARTCLPADVAHAVTYLASPAASFVTGTVLTVSGGLVTW
jgi:NAD(P)-dependent dehydrogenase (short-subunit alcohol dehydrogenase family)